MLQRVKGRLAKGGRTTFEIGAEGEFNVGKLLLNLCPQRSVTIPL
jgi:hypothetical protein